MLLKTGHRSVSGNLFSLTYLLVASLLSNLSPVPEIVKSILALPSFLIVPYLFGTAIAPVIKRLSIDYDRISRFIISWWCGVTMMFLFGFMMDFLGFFNMTIYAVVILFVIVVSSIYKFGKEPRKEIGNTVFDSKAETYRIILSAIIGLVPAVYYLNFLPFPQQYHNVLPNHNREVLEVLADAPYHYHMSPISYTISSYLLLAMPSFLFNIKPHVFFWATPLIFYPLLSVGLNVFSYHLSKNSLVSLLASYVGVWIMTYLGGFQENYSVTPRAFLYVFFPFALYLVQKEISSKNMSLRDVVRPFLMIIACFLPYYILLSLFFHRIFSPPFMPKNWQIIATFPLLSFTFFRRILSRDHLTTFELLFLITITFVVLHSFEAILYVFVVFLYMVNLVILKKSNKSKFLAYGVITFGYLLVLLQCQGILRIPKFNLSSYFLGSTASEWDYLGVCTLFDIFVKANTFLLFVLFLIGTLVMSFTGPDNLAIATTSSIIFFLYFLPDPFTYRIGASLAPFMMYSIALLLMKILPNLVSRAFNSIKVILRKDFTIGKSTLYLTFFIATLILITPVITQPIQRYHHPWHVTKFEYLATDFIWETMKKETQENTFVISDARTTALISGLTYTQSLFPSFMAEKEYSNEDVDIINYIKYSVFAASDSRTTWNALEELRRAKSALVNWYNIESMSKIIVVITGRTLKWLTWPTEDRFLFYETDNISDYNNTENPGFETGNFLGWRLYGNGTWVVQKEESYEGEYAAKLMPHASNNVTILTSRMYLCQPGEELSFQAYVKNDNISHFQIGFFFYNNSRKLIAQFSKDIEDTNFNWKLEKINTTAPEGATLYRPGFFLKAGVNSSSVYIDYCCSTDFLKRTLNKFLDEHYFKLLFKVNDEIYIFEQKLQIDIK